MQRISALTSIRGLAAWWVVLYHFQDGSAPFFPNYIQTFVAHGYLAVDLFFVLSGFVISFNYLTKFHQIKLANVAQFFGLRIARIYPLHIVILLLFVTIPVSVTLFSTAKMVTDQFDIKYFILSVALLQNWGFTDELAWNIPAWSISTEFAAYLLFPAIAWATLKFLRTPVRAAVFIATLIVILIIGFSLTANSLGARIPQLGVFRCLLEFDIGVCIYYLWYLRGAARASDANSAMTGAAVLVVVYAVLPVPDYLVLPFSFALLVYGLACDDAWVVRMLEMRPLVMLGEISYSTYMVHYFIKMWTKFLLMKQGIPMIIALIFYIVATALSSILLYQFVEVPGRRAFRRRILGRNTTPAPSSVGV